MLLAFSRNWWALVLRGLAALIFGVVAILWPGITVAVLVILFGAYAFVDGVFAIAAGIRGSAEIKRWWLLLIEGLFSIAAGAIAFVWPGITALVLVVLVGVWAIATGIMEIVAAIQLRKYITGEWLLVVSGLLSTAFGVLLLFDPLAGAFAVAWIIGIYAMVFGILLISLGFRLRGLERAPHGMTPHPV